MSARQRTRNSRNERRLLLRQHYARAAAAPPPPAAAAAADDEDLRVMPSVACREKQQRFQYSVILP